METKTTRLILLLILMVRLIVTSVNIKAQQPKFFVEIDEELPTILNKFDYASKTKKLIYQSKKDIITDINISPGNNYISLLEIAKGSEEKGVFKVLPKGTLIILDSEGYIVECIDEDVQRYVWGPKGNKVVYITGTYSENTKFIPTGIYILDIKTKEKTKIEHVQWPFILHWVSNDEENAIYIKTLENKILKYNIPKNRLEVVHVYGIHFSPDGKYYVMYPGETILAGLCEHDPLKSSSCLHIYESKTNKLTAQYSESYGKPVDWVYNQGHLFLFTKEEYYGEPRTIKRGDKTFTAYQQKGLKSVKNFVYDVATNKLIQQFSGKILNAKGWSESNLTHTDYLPVEKIEENIKKDKEIIIQKIPSEYQNK